MWNREQGVASYPTSSSDSARRARGSCSFWPCVRSSGATACRSCASPLYVIWSTRSGSFFASSVNTITSCRSREILT
ncbi:cysteine-rich small domain-containing protein [Bordetella muralis]|uniref:cysteine-rich small domain-containing protein n=1 Tax=Bordetella muralis TaxID=1649130 RepID=UPI0039F035A7